MRINLQLAKKQKTFFSIFTSKKVVFQHFDLLSINAQWASGIVFEVVGIQYLESNDTDYEVLLSCNAYRI